MGLMCTAFTSVLILYLQNLGRVHNFKQYNFSTGVEAPYFHLLIHIDIMIF